MDMTMVRLGTFSGIATSVLAALRRRTDVDDVDIRALAREPRLIPSRVAAQLEARRERAPWAKTTAWSRATQGALARRGVFDSGRPLIYMQSLIAHDLPPGLPYAVYLDRVGLEGHLAGDFSPGYSRGWLEREKAFMRKADRIFLMGPTTKEFLVRDYGVDEGSISVVGGGANLPVPETPPTTGPGTRLLFVGKEWERKGGDDLLAAFARLKRARPDVTLVLVGSSPPGEVPDGVTALGSVPHERMLQLYLDADVLVIPTYAEPFGVSFVEALRLGMPCVGTTVGNQRWIIEDAGECVEPGDVDALAGALEMVVNNYPVYRERAERRSVAIKSTFDWDVVAGKMLTWAEGTSSRPN